MASRWSAVQQALIPILVKALQEADAKIDALTTRIDSPRRLTTGE
jgi:hypothetical protein